MQVFFADFSPWHFTLRQPHDGGRRPAGRTGTGRTGAGRQDAVLLRFLAAQAAIALAAGLLLGRIGGFGTYRELAAFDRYAYWLALTALDWGLIVGLATLLRRLPAAARLPVPAQAALAALGAAIPTTAVVWWLESLLRFMQEVDGLRLYVNVAVISLALALLVALLCMAAARNAPVPAQKAVPAPPAAFLNRIPPPLGRELLALQAEDHYLRIHTAKGSALILFRLRDALAELGGLDGLQVHRGWWVARRAVAGHGRSDGRTELRLSNGLVVPVSRGCRPAVKAAGWLG
ncbi:LytTR family DNA-binding domain-containing protein [Ferrovibrio sp.]|uniref:LytTR family DNA-binding domain-containing protein n=1 Tax=Ferrovibrio sp. TaxID=1917215 RepID=UPI00351120F7